MRYWETKYTGKWKRITWYKRLWWKIFGFPKLKGWTMTGSNGVKIHVSPKMTTPNFKQDSPK